MTFKQAVYNTSDLGEAFRPGKQALLSSHRKCLRCSNPTHFVGSIALEERLPAAQWDYGVGLRRNSGEMAIWVEVHSAKTSEVPTMLRKLKWLKDWLCDRAPALKELTNQRSYYWVATGSGVHISPNSPEARNLRRNELHWPQKQVHLD